MTPDSKDETGSVVSVWDDQAASYDSERRADPVYLSCIRQVANSIPKGTSVCLDVGCGTGLSTTVLRDRCDLVIAIDFSIESLKVLKAKGLPNVFVVQADLTALPFKNSAVEACVCANTLQHFRPNGPQERAIAELNRVTKEGGKLSISVHHYSKSKRRAGWIKEGKPGQPGIDYIYRFSMHDFQTLLPGSAIRSVGYYGLMQIPYLGSRLQDFLAGIFGGMSARLGFGHMLVAVATKGGRDTSKTVDA